MVLTLIFALDLFQKYTHFMLSIKYTYSVPPIKFKISVAFDIFT